MNEKYNCCIDIKWVLKRRKIKWISSGYYPPIEDKLFSDAHYNYNHFVGIVIIVNIDNREKKRVFTILALIFMIFSGDK